MNTLRLLPASTNGEYDGSPLAAWFLTLVALLTIGPGLVHSFLPDGGAGVIAGIDLSRNGAAIVAAFAWAGATQIAWGAFLLVASLRYRSLVPLLLALLALERGLIVADLWLGEGGGTGHHPPGAYGALVAVPLILAALVLPLRREPAGGGRKAREAS